MTAEQPLEQPSHTLPRADKSRASRIAHRLRIKRNAEAKLQALGYQDDD